jgi:antitoxin ChpS
MTHLRKVGGSIMLAVPSPLLKSLGLQPGTPVDVAVENGRLVVAPRTRPRYTLAELLAQCKPDKARSRQDREWTGGGPAGRELI